MTGIVLVTHGNLGQSLLATATLIFKKEPARVVAITINADENTEILLQRIKQAIKSVKQQNGTLILTDMFGGSPSNLSYCFLKDKNIEVLSGVNLPILLKALELREDQDITSLADLVAEYGQKSIVLASNILKGNK